MGTISKDRKGVLVREKAVDLSRQERNLEQYNLGRLAMTEKKSWSVKLEMIGQGRRGILVSEISKD